MQFQTKYKDFFLLENIEGAHFIQLTRALNQKYIFFLLWFFALLSIIPNFNPQLQKETLSFLLMDHNVAIKQVLR